jgi:hypothetical protein
MVNMIYIDLRSVRDVVLEAANVLVQLVCGWPR